MATGPRILNTLTGLVEAFAPRSAPFSWYMCGPTVYDKSHLGHARTYVCFDVIRRVLRDVFRLDSTLVMGITDVDDKIIDRARQAGHQSIEDVSREYEDEFFRSMAALNVEPADRLMRVSEHMDEIVGFIDGIQRNGFAYVNDVGDVVFDCKKFHATEGLEYGKLQPANFNAPGRSSDFALWKRSSRDEIACWDSPWGTGRPGWHIECSAMSTSAVGPDLDVHSGGIDLKFPHHNNEKAQCDAFYKSNDWATSWWHTGHVYIDGLKMSKSLKNFITIDEFLKSSSADAFRMFCLLHRYGSGIHFTDQGVRDADNVLNTFDNFNARLDSVIGRAVNGDHGRQKWTVEAIALQERFMGARQQVVLALGDNFDTPKAIAILLDLISNVHEHLDSNRVKCGSLLWQIRAFVNRLLQTFGLQTAPAQVSSERPWRDAVQLLVDFRQEIRSTARSSSATLKDILVRCDHLRATVQDQLGVQISDGPHGKSVWTASR
ncbi:cysteine--tRNA ligase [Plasmodiophora brassicae]